MTKQIYIIYILLILSFGALAQPKHEFRAVWVASVANIDWPSTPKLNADQQKAEAIAILDKHKENGCNAVIMQVRPASDALYASEIEPWSRYLTGEQGKAPVPFYDPLQFWIEESHQRGMEFHAWFNPYRIKQKLDDALVENHIIHQNPNWGWEYGNRLYFEPGEPAVWDYVTSIVVDVVERYDVDAIHFDDYFYPYQIQGETLPDADAFKKYGGKYYPDHIDDWRRHNCDTIIHKLSLAIKETKPWVKFGISPFGVWRNKSEDPMGSDTKAGSSNYDQLYADVLLWQRNGWIDYLMPQLYWRDYHPAADFTILSQWWNDFAYGRAMYIGLGPYKVDKKSKYKYWRSQKSISKQIEQLRDIENIHGYGFFSSKSFFNEKNQKMNKMLRTKTCAQEAIVPPMPWINNEAPLPPTNIGYNNGTLTWDAANEANPMNKGRFFVVYRYNNAERSFKKAEHIISVTGETQLKINEKGVYRISALDRTNNESQLSDPILVK